MKDHFNKHIPSWIIVLAGVLWLFGLVVTLIPILYMVIWSLWGTEVVGQLRSLSQITTKWYISLVSDESWLESLTYSTFMATTVSIIGTLVNAIYIYFIRITYSLYDRVTFFLNVTVLLIPLIVYAISLSYIGSLIGLSEPAQLFIGHLVWVMPLQYLVFESFRDSIHPETIMASRTMGASHFKSFLYVFIPVVRTPVASSIVLGFFISFDEVVIANYVIDSPTKTVPLKLWKEQSHTVDPDSAVITVILVALISVVFYLFSE